MDAGRFDSLVRYLSVPGSRRQALAALAASLGLIPLLEQEDAFAAKSGKCKPKCGECQTCKKGKCDKKNGKKSCKKGKCQAKGEGTACAGGSCRSGSCVAPNGTILSPATGDGGGGTTVPPTCSDGIRNGNETGVDCGGTCPRCLDGGACLVAEDCLSGTCFDGSCVPCTVAQLCGTNSQGATCQCHFDEPSNEPVCDNNQMLGFTVADCGLCPQGTESCVAVGAAGFNCFQRCAST